MGVGGGGGGGGGGLYYTGCLNIKGSKISTLTLFFHQHSMVY